MDYRIFGAGCLDLCWYMVVWRIASYFIPPDHYSGVELYESGEYLQYDDGALFRDHIAQLPFAEDADVLSFDYYDFHYRDAFFKNDPFPDLYMIKIASTISLDSVERHLKACCYLEENSEDSDSAIIYCLSDPNNAEAYFFVVVDHSDQGVYCLLVIDDYMPYDSIDYYFYRYIGDSPWERLASDPG